MIQLNKGKTKFDGYASPKIASRNSYVLRGVSIPCNNESSLVLDDIESARGGSRGGWGGGGGGGGHRGHVPPLPFI